jgi:phage-related protein
MAIGFNDGVANRIPDRAMQKQSTARVLLASFGDGYEQRLPLGINSLAQEYGVTFKTRPKAEIDDIATFLENTKGANSFSFTVPNTNSTNNESTIKVVCGDFSTTYEYDDFYTLEATFRRVYEP